MRLFIAVLFEEETIDEICALRDSLNAHLGRASWTKRENMHLTMEFLSECSAKERDKVLEIIEESEFVPFEIVMDRVGFFKRKEGDTLYLAAREDKPLIALQSEIRESLREEGFIVDKRKYKPHITLARRLSRGISADIKPIKTKVSKVSLMRSEFTDFGMRYTELN